MARRTSDDWDDATLDDIFAGEPAREPSTRRTDVPPTVRPRRPPAPPRHSNRPPLWLLAVVGLLVLFALGVLAGTFLGVGGGTTRAPESAATATVAQPTPTPSATTSATTTPKAQSKPIAIASAAAYDPLGDNEEHDSDTHLAVDGDPTTAWTTDRYSTADLGGLKPGVGLAVDLGAAHDISRVAVTFGVAGTSLAVYVGDAPTHTGSPAAVVQDAAGAINLPMHAHGRYVTLWLTQLPPADGGGYRGVVREVAVTG